MTCINFTDARITALKPCRATHDIRDTKLKSVPVGMVPTWEAHAGTASKMWTAGPGIGSGGLRSGEAPCVRHHSTRTSDPVQRSAAHHRDPCDPGHVPRPLFAGSVSRTWPPSPADAHT